MEQKRALITGITGQDGSYLAELLVSKGYEVYGLVRRSGIPRLDFIEHLPIRLIYGDILDPVSVREAIKKAQPHEVYNLAGQSHVGLSFSQPTLTAQVNYVGVANLLDAILTFDPTIRFYQASTSEMYGNATHPDKQELTPMRPVSPYGISKLAAHHLVGMYRDSHNLHGSCGILFNHESPRRGLDFVTHKITDGIARIYYGLQESISLGNLYALRDWGFAGDYVQAMWLMLQQDNPGDYVIATGISHSIEEFLSAAFGYLSINDWTRYVKFEESLRRPTDIYLLQGDARKAKEVLGWQPEVSFEELVALMMRADLERYRNEDKHRTHLDFRGSHLGRNLALSKE